MGKFHGIRPAPLGHGSQVGGVGQHLRERRLSLDDGRAAFRIHSLDAPAPAVEVAHDVARVVLRHGDFNVHDGLDQAGFGLFDGLLERLRARQLEGNFRGVHLVIRAVVKDDAEVDHGAARQVPPRGCVDDLQAGKQIRFM